VRTRKLLCSCTFVINRFFLWQTVAAAGRPPFTIRLIEHTLARKHIVHKVVDIKLFAQKKCVIPDNVVERVCVGYRVAFVLVVDVRE
jgi:hypothetical protein